MKGLNNQFFDKTVPRMIVEARGIEVKRGGRSGRCVFCMEETNCGFDAKFPDTFVSFDRVYSGGVICPYCYHVFKEAGYRRNHWVVTPSFFSFLDNESALRTLLDPPREPFAIYVTRSRRKHGWIRIARHVNFSRERFLVGFDEEVVMVDRKRLEEIVDLVGRLRALKIPKSEIASGHFSPNSLRKIIDGGVDPEPTRRVSGSPLIEIVVTLVR